MSLRTTTYRRQAYKSGSVFSVGPTTARYLILILLAVFSLLFLIESAQGSNGLLQIRSLENQKSDLNKERATLQANASRWESLQTIGQSATTQGLVPVSGPADTITVPPDSPAK